MKRTLTSILFSLFFIFIASEVHAQQQRERMIAMTRYYGNPLTPYDSTTYTYSGTRSMDSIWGIEQEFDSAYTWRYTDTNNYSPYHIQYSTYDSSNRVLSDTTWTLDTATGIYSYYEYWTYTYTTGGLPSTAFTYTWSNSSWATFQQLFKLYDTAGNQIEEYILQGADTAQVSYLSYNGHTYATGTGYGFNFSNVSINRNREVFDSLGRFESIESDYRHNANSPWIPLSLYTYSYDSVGDLSQAMIYTWDTATGWYVTGRELFIFDGNHNQLQCIIQTLDTPATFVNTNHYLAAFDSYNMRTLYEYDKWDTTGGGQWVTNGNTYHFYYELYDLPNGIATIASQADLRIYPVPAADMLSLDVKWQEAQSATATIYDAAGRKYTEWALPNTSSYHGYVPVSALPAGIFTLQIKGNCGSITRSFDVMR